MVRGTECCPGINYVRWAGGYLVDVAPGVVYSGFHSTFVLLDETLLLILGSRGTTGKVRVKFYEFDRNAEIERHFDPEFNLINFRHNFDIPQELLQRFLPKRICSFECETGRSNEFFGRFVYMFEVAIETNWKNDFIILDGGACFKEDRWEEFPDNDDRPEFSVLDGYSQLPIEALLVDDRARDFIAKLGVRAYRASQLDMDFRTGNRLPKIGLYRRRRNWSARGPHAILRALVGARRAIPDQRRDTFLYDTAPDLIFKEVVLYI